MKGWTALRNVNSAIASARGPGASHPPAEKPAEPAKSPPPVPPLNLAKGGTRRLKTPEHGSKPLHLMSPGQNLS